jgi:hypothetical protein
MILGGIKSFSTRAPRAEKAGPAMQVADLIAWEVRKALFQMKPWQLSPDRPLDDRVNQMRHYLEWCRQATGADPILRKSLNALIVHMPTHSVVWDWHQLDEVNKFRNGIWTLEESE